jgi:Ca2+ transporting ATPase
VYLDHLNNSISSFAAKGERTFLLAYKEVKSIPENWDEIEKDLVIVAMVGLKDPLRDGTHETISIAKQSGITVRMITGDNETNAINIAKEAGILAEDWEPSEGDYSVMKGRDLREFVGGLNYE